MINYVVTNSLYVVTNDTWKTIDHSIKCITFAMIVKQNKYVNHPQPTIIYNPQNEMFWYFRTKCSFPKTKRTSLILFLFITYNKKASKKNVFLRCFLLCYL